ncbi:flagellar protein [Psychrobacillus glaciei]|uniref:Flagellar protein n=1 Tax=Psychrobacillus glaciei TaxID=2283160 RepID=A0A5J6SM74_9BACI|nr:flagellar biosynthetic protein FliO [Psychrobacillus glaciei]QFF98543.1 flagellar protein [Psychrobacillus glaciei]
MKQFQKRSRNEMKRKFTIIYCIFCLLILLPFQTVVHAATDPNGSIDDYYSKLKDEPTQKTTLDTDTDTNKDLDKGSGGVSVGIWDYVKMIFALAFVILLLYGLLRFVNSKNKTYQTHQLIQNLGGVGISQGKSVQLLQVGNSLFLVGIGEDVSLLKEITDPEEISKLTKKYDEKLEIGKTVPYITELFSLLKGNLSKKKNRNEKKEPTFNETFQKRLQEIQKDRSDVIKDWKTKEREENE